MAVELTPSRLAAQRRGGNGFSLVELMISSVVFLMMMVGILPLFTQATVNTSAAAESTSGVNFARSQLEEYQQLAFNSPQLAPNSDTPREEYFSLATGKWVLGEPPTDGSDAPLLFRTTTVRQYNVSALDDGVLDPDSEALPDGSHGAWIHLKEITVEIASGRSGGALGAPQTFIFHLLKSN